MDFWALFVGMLLGGVPVGVLAMLATEESVRLHRDLVKLRDAVEKSATAKRPYATEILWPKVCDLLDGHPVKLP